VARAEDERVVVPQKSVMEEEGKDVPPVILAMEDEYEAMAAAPGLPAEEVVEGATLPAGRIAGRQHAVPLRPHLSPAYLSAVCMHLLCQVPWGQGPRTRDLLSKRDWQGA